MLSPKELKKLAAACRSAGIKHYKTADFEFTLTDEVPLSNYKKKVEKIAESVQAEVETDDTLTGDALLFWSTADITNENNEEAQP